jgi:hypothetical protein
MDPDKQPATNDDSWELWRRFGRGELDEPPKLLTCKIPDLHAQVLEEVAEFAETYADALLKDGLLPQAIMDHILNVRSLLEWHAQRICESAKPSSPLLDQNCPPIMIIALDEVASLLGEYTNVAIPWVKYSNMTSEAMYVD